jgi:hypothetical protein
LLPAIPIPTFHLHSYWHYEHLFGTWLCEEGCTAFRRCMYSKYGIFLRQENPKIIYKVGNMHATKKSLLYMKIRENNDFCTFMTDSAD